VIEAFMKSKGLKADTVKYTNIDPAARIGMLVAKKIPAIETFAMSMPGVVKAAGGAEAQIFLLANAGLSLYSNGIQVRDDYLKAEPAKVKAFDKASLQGWKDTVANPKQAADIVGKHFAGPGRGTPDIVALQDVSYSFKQGELVALLGPSGCGKTTLLWIVAGMTRVSHGRVEIRGREVVGPQDDFGFVFQAPNLLP